MDYKLVIAVREDLKLSIGKLAVQVAHAAVNCSMSAKKKDTKIYNSWYSEGQKKVVVRAFDLKHIFDLKTQAEGLKLITSIVEDAGLTEVPPGTVTCLGIGPGKNEVIDKVTGNLKLL